MKLIIFIATSFTTTIGMKWGGISANKLCILPLYLYLMMTTILIGKHKVTIPNKNLALFYMGAIVSCILGLLSDNDIYYDGYSSSLILYLIQCLFIYLPLYIFMCMSSHKEEIKEYFISCFLWSIRIQALFGTLQLICYYVAFFDIGKYVSELVAPFITVESASGTWSSIGWFGSSVYCRPRGFTNDPNFLCVLLVLGAFIEKRKLLKLLYVVIILLSGTRSPLLVLAGVVLIRWIQNILKMKKLTEKKSSIQKAVVSIVVIVVAVAVIYNNVSAVQEIADKQINLLASRMDIFSRSGSKSESTMRHIMYYPYGLYSFLVDTNIFQKIVGVGPRTSGSFLQLNGAIASALNMDYSTAWPLECDVMEVLLGFGLLGFLSYYGTVYYLYKKNTSYKAFFLAIALYGVMYGIASLTIVQLIFIVFSSQNNRGKTLTVGSAEISGVAESKPASNATAKFSVSRVDKLRML